MEEKKNKPDEILRVIQEDEQSSKNGHLKIFFGYAAGVGKTYAMLKDANAAKRRGVDVVIGYVEPHARPQTAALTQNLECLSLMEDVYNGIAGPQAAAHSGR